MYGQLDHAVWDELPFPEGILVMKSIAALVALFLTLPVASQALADAVRRSEDNEAPHDSGQKD